MYTPTITSHDLLEGDILLYRWNSVYSFVIRIYEAIRAFDLDRLFIAFTHIAQIVENRWCGCIMRYDSMEWFKTGFRPITENAYVFRWKEPLTLHQKMIWRNYLLSREWSSYDLIWAVTEWDDVFGDFCSELVKNSLVACEKIPDTEYLSPYQFYLEYRDQLDFIWVIL